MYLAFRQSLRALLLIILSPGLAVAATTPFTDNDLADLLKKEPVGILYAWSPHMPLSIQGMVEARQVASELKISFTAVLDPFAPDSTISPEGARDLPLSPIASRQLIERGILDHFPTIILFKDGALLRRHGIIHGYENKDGLRDYLGDYLELGEKK